MDKLERAVEQLVTAIHDEGVAPEYHRAIQVRSRHEWPTLWEAIDAILEARRQRLAQLPPVEPKQSGTNIVMPKPWALEIKPQGELLVRIGQDGEIEYGPNYDPDETAKVFWNAIAHWFPAERRSTV